MAQAKQIASAARTIVVGDLHGCYDELLALLAEVDFGSNDRVIAVGDLVVKGPKNREVLDRFVSDPRFSSVIGNQDRALLRFWRGEKSKLTGSQKKAAKELESNREEYVSYLASLPNLIDLGAHVVVHAGVRPGIPIDEQSPADLTKLRTLGKKRASRKGVPWYEVYDGEKIVLFGHWPATEPRIARRAVGLDTGCVYGNRLTAFIVETGELRSVPAKMVYRKGNLLFREEAKDAFRRPPTHARSGPSILISRTDSIHHQALFRDK